MGCLASVVTGYSVLVLSTVCISVVLVVGTFNNSLSFAKKWFCRYIGVINSVITGRKCNVTGATYTSFLLSFKNS